MQHISRLVGNKTLPILKIAAIVVVGFITSIGFVLQSHSTASAAGYCLVLKSNTEAQFYADCDKRTNPDVLKKTASGSIYEYSKSTKIGGSYTQNTTHRYDIRNGKFTTGNAVDQRAGMHEVKITVIDERSNDEQETVEQTRTGKKETDPLARDLQGKFLPVYQAEACRENSGSLWRDQCRFDEFFDFVYNCVNNIKSSSTNQNKDFADCLSKRLNNTSSKDVENFIKDKKINIGQYVENVDDAHDSVGSEDENTEDDEESSCQVDGIGWFICPVINFMANLSDGAFGVISNFLEVDTDLVAAENSNGTYNAWKGFRTVANLAFIIVFLIIIYSQMTSTMISNYGIKQMLPKLIIAVVLVNLSYFICQILVDVSNILGYSIKNFLANMSSGSPLDRDFISVTMTDVLKGGSLVATLAISAVVGAVAVALGVATPVLLAVLLALLMTLVILIARQAGIVILTVLAPLAFVAYILPNTEQWFKKWMKTFWGLLMVFPLVGLLYGGGQLAAKIIMGAGSHSFWMAITAIGVSAVPLIMTPTLLKGAMNATGAIGAKLSGFAGKANSKIGARVKDSSALGSRMQEFQAGSQRRRAAGQIRARTSKGWRGEALDNTLRAMRLDQRLGADRGSILADQAEDKLFTEEVGLQQIAQNGLSSGQWAKNMENSQTSVEERAAAAGLLMKSGSVEEQYKALESARSMMANAQTKEEKNAVSLIQKQMVSDMKGKPWGISGKHMGMLREGKLGLEETETHDTPVMGAPNSIMGGRLIDKLGSDSLAGLDPDEFKMIASMAENDQLKPEALNNFIAQATAARRDPNLTSRIKAPEKAAQIDRVLRKAGVDPQTTYPPSQASSNDPQSSSPLGGQPPSSGNSGQPSNAGGGGINPPPEATGDSDSSGPTPGAGAGDPPTPPNPLNP